MEFWGVEVKSGTPLKVQPGEGMIIHLSQASFGEVKANKIESVSLIVNVEGKKLVLGTLMSDKLPQQLFDLVFDRDFELSHNLKSGSIYFFGYKSTNPAEEYPLNSFYTDESEDDDIPLDLNNGKPEIKAKADKPVIAEKAKDTKVSAAGKQKVQILEPTKDEKPEEDDDSSDDDGSSDEDGASDEDMVDEDDSDSEDEESDEDDDTPKKAAPSKKRGAESAIKTPVSEKKAKLVTPQKTDGKKSVHVATPHPSKQAGKTPATNKASQQTPKSAGSHSCGPCKKTFASENALQSHAKAKHSAGK
ncbi:hypothetical protein LIER_06444 [Lithospermum erythrorhizon]|uniref:C2H2-type domain-containing protein n=1 Tax=Lithospermum erythrorhizon TaxID=34254 RepID=A0AAV3P8C2_LITER